MQRLASSLQNSQSLTFTARSEGDIPNGRIDTVRGFAEKPNKFCVEEVVNGQNLVTITSDGKTVAIYQASTKSYSTMTALKNYAEWDTKAVREQTTDLLGDAFLPVLMFFSGDPGLIGTPGPPGTARPAYHPFPAAPSGGAAVRRVIRPVAVPPNILFNNVALMYNFQAETGALQRLEMGLMSANLSRFGWLLRLSFSSFQLSSSPLPPSVFAWNPPSGSVRQDKP